MTDKRRTAEDIEKALIAEVFSCTIDGRMTIKEGPIAKALEDYAKQEIYRLRNTELSPFPCSCRFCLFHASVDKDIRQKARNEGIEAAKKVAFKHECKYAVGYGTTMCSCSSRIANDIEDLKRGGR